MNKESFEEVKIEVIQFETEDVITESWGIPLPWDD